MQDERQSLFIIEGRGWRKNHGSSIYGMDVEMWVDKPYPHLVSVHVERGSRTDEKTFDERLDAILGAPGATWKVRASRDHGLVCLLDDVTAHPAPDEPAPAFTSEAADRDLVLHDEIMALVTRPDVEPIRFAKLLLSTCLMGLLDGTVETRLEVRAQSIAVATLTRGSRSLGIAVTRNGDVSNAATSEKYDVDVARDAVRSFMLDR
jgi:hypothetical protein